MRRLSLIAGILALAGAGSMLLQAPPVLAQPTGLTREVTIEGLDSRSLRDELRALSSVADSGRDYTSAAAIRRAARGDVDRMMQALSSKGYYAAAITPLVTRDGSAVTVVFEIERGPLFQIDVHRISYTDDTAEERPQTLAEIGIEAGPDPTGDALAALESQLVTWLERHGYPWVSGRRHYVRANFDTGQATAVYELASGPRTTFGKPVVAETPRTRERFIAAWADWEEGALFDKREMLAYRERLVETGLFRQVSVEPEAPGEDGRTDIEVTVTERERRTIGTGLSYATDIGPGVNVSWQDRNLLRGGESLTAQAALSDPEQLVGLSFAKPLPRLPGSFNASTSLRNEISDAFEAKTVEASTGLSKTFFDRDLEVSGGLGLVFTQVEDAVGAAQRGEAEQFYYVRFPGRIAWDNQNDVLNPTDGFRAAFTLTPYVGDASFLRSGLNGATRFIWGEENRYTLAFRGNIGASFGAGTFDIPATERFYAGGGGSVRGFAYQEAGPLDMNGDPVGGSSLIELNSEARYNLRDKIQLAAFIDGGSVFDSEVPDFSEELLWGAGLGGRYLTPIGPVRVDVATPLNPRDSDDRFFLYIALGQPF